MARQEGREFRQAGKLRLPEPNHRGKQASKTELRTAVEMQQKVSLERWERPYLKRPLRQRLNLLRPLHSTRSS